MGGRVLAPGFLWEDERGSQLTVGLFSGELFDVESPSLSVDGLDFAFFSLKCTSHDFHDITLADGDGAHVVLGLQFLIQVATHDSSFD